MRRKFYLVRHRVKKLSVPPGGLLAEFPLNILDKISHPMIKTDGDVGQGRPDPVASITLEAERNFTQPSWNQFRNFAGSNFMQLRGFVSIDHQVYYVDATMDQFSIVSIPQITPNRNRLVLIGQRLNEEEIEIKFLNSISLNGRYFQSGVHFS